MGVLVGIRDRIKAFYAQFSGVLNVCGKFLLAVFVFLFINREIGFNPVFSNMFIILIMALIASILSIHVMVALSAVMILGNAFSLGIDIFGVTAVLLLLLLLMFAWYVPDDAGVLIAEPLGLALGVPALVPICCGLKRSPSSIAAIVPGVVVHYYIHALSESAEALEALGSREYSARLALLLGTLTQDRTIVVTIISAAAVVIIVYAIRKLEADYAFLIAVIAGAILNIVMAFLSNSALDLGVSLGQVILNTLISLALALVFLFFIHHVAYNKTERLTFEDDEYYYYVKAVPKVVARFEEDYEDDEEDEEEEEEMAKGILDGVDIDKAIEEMKTGSFAPQKKTDDATRNIEAELAEAEAVLAEAEAVIDAAGAGAEKPSREA